MSIIVSFLIGAVLGFLGSWFVWKNNKKKWEAVEAKYQYFSDNIKTVDKFCGKSKKDKDA